jgi:formylglycine-generating enzyme required for sulfatase activity
VTSTNAGYPATVSSYYLDQYEVTVGRFRTFVAAWVAGYRPPAGSGKHTHLAGGGIAGESGWDAAWSVELPATPADWDAALVCSGSLAVWTPTPGPNDAKPMTCLSWYEAYAFCIHDGAFLPTEAEWDYAAAGGSEQRVYPWSSPPTSTVVDPSYAVYDCRADGSSGGFANCALSDIPNVGCRSPLGDGRWGHADLGGSAIEWVLDWWASPYRSTDCIDCADLTSTTGNRIYRSGSFIDSEAVMLVASHDYYGGPAGRGSGTGVRCARAP